MRKFTPEAEGGLEKAHTLKGEYIFIAFKPNNRKNDKCCELAFLVSEIITPLPYILAFFFSFAYRLPY